MSATETKYELINNLAREIRHNYRWHLTRTEQGKTEQALNHLLEARNATVRLLEILDTEYQFAVISQHD